jgi:hypothetical protein
LGIQHLPFGYPDRIQCGNGRRSDVVDYDLPVSREQARAEELEILADGRQEKGDYPQAPVLHHKLVGN